MSAFKKYFVDTLKYRYADFSGRASRSEYWFFILFSILILFVWLFVMGGSAFISSTLSSSSISENNPLTGSGGFLSKISGIIMGLFILSMVIPFFAVSIRRLHDVGRSGWWYLLRLVPLGGLVIFIFSVLESEPGRNKWGPNPWDLDDGTDEISQHLIEDYDKL